jgi:hypothetical protein
MLKRLFGRTTKTRGFIQDSHSPPNAAYILLPFHRLHVNPIGRLVHICPPLVGVKSERLLNIDFILVAISD